MALDTYANLKTAIADWLARSSLSTYIDDFLTLGQQRLANELRIREIEAALSTTIASGEAPAPSDFLELKHARLAGDPTFPLEMKESNWLYRKFPTRSSTSKPEYIAIDGSSFVFGPYPDSTYTINGIYWKKPAALSDSNTTNEWTESAPDILLYACLIETAPFIRDDKRLGMWEAKYQEKLEAYEKREKRKMRRGTRVSYN